MTNPRQYGKAGLYPEKRRKVDTRGYRSRVNRKNKEPYVVEHLIKEAAKTFGMVGPAGENPRGGGCCIPCRRYLEPSMLNPSPSKRQRRRILAESACSHCGRTQLDQDLIERGFMAVARERQLGGPVDGYSRTAERKEVQVAHVADGCPTG